MERVRRIPLQVNTAAPGGHTAAYLLGDEETLLVDPAARSPELDEAVDSCSVGHIAVTHTHPDHVGAVAEYAMETDTTVWARRGREQVFTAATGVEPDRTFVDGTTVGPTTAFYTPGHVADHTAFSITGESGGGATCEALATGDIAVAEGSVVVAAPEGDMRAYLTSLRRLYARNPARLYPAHGDVIDDPRETLGRLVAHRLDREHRVATAVRDGADSIDDVLERAYDKSLEGVEELARATVRAHLLKLAVEARTADCRNRYRTLTGVEPNQTSVGPSE
jgi:glyoxylase-like metal-dependent hydrolase (beta-lactamase superfamily II)